MIVFIKEQSWFAKQAAKRLRSERVAIVWRRTIHLWGASKTEFLQTPAWVRHEMVHIYQYQKYGWLRFIYLYLRESLKKGYYHNFFEEEARNGEHDDFLLENVTFR